MLAESITTSNIEGHPWQDPPELLLWREVIKLAVNDYQSETTSWAGLTPYQRRYAREQAGEWLFATERTPGSFLWVCEWLDVRPEIILRRLKPQQRLPRRRRIYALTARLGIEYRRLNDRRRRSVPAVAAGDALRKKAHSLQKKHNPEKNGFHIWLRNTKTSLRKLQNDKIATN